MGKAIEEARKLVHAPFEARHMRAVERETRVARHEAIAHRHQLFVARLLGVPVHIIFGMLAEIAPVIVGRHLIERQPAILGLALMRDQRHAPRLELRDDRIEARIVEEHALARGILRHHPDILPYLDRHRAPREPRIDLLFRPRRPARRAETVHREGGSEMEALGIGRMHRISDPRLLRDRREIGIIDVDRQ